jgi:hypothetical protein
VRILLLFVVLLAVGCRPSAAPSAADKPSDPDEVLRGQISQGAFSLTAATESLAEAKTTVADMEANIPGQGDLRDDWLDLTEYVDSCGRTITDFTDEPPALDVFKTQIPEQRKRLKTMLEAATGSLQELYEAVGIVDSMLEAPPAKLKAGLEGLADSLDTAVEDLTTAIKDMGGTPSPPPDSEER